MLLLLFLEKYEQPAAESAAGFRPIESAEDQGEPLRLHRRRDQKCLSIARHSQVSISPQFFFFFFIIKINSFFYLLLLFFYLFFIIFIIGIIIIIMSK